jgi:hypothetical protein
MTAPQPKPRRARRVIRKNKLPDYLGNQPTQIEELVRLGLLKLISLSPGGRSKCAFEDNVIELQEAAEQAGSLEALVAQARAERDAAA